jgi:phenylacetate-CoA ligase
MVLRKLTGYLQSHAISAEIEERLERLHHSDEADSMLLQARLDRLLRHATNTTPFYRGHAGASFAEFPVVSKNQIRASMADFMSASRPQRSWRSISTSGSTGEPFRILQDRGKVRAQRADVIAFNRAAGWQPGQRIMFLRVWQASNRLGPIQRWVGRIRPVDGADLSLAAARSLHEMMARMREPFMLLGYGSSLDALATNLLRLGIGRTQSGIHACVAMAEPVSGFSRAVFNDVYGVKIRARYSNAENGIIAHEVPGSDGYWINEASFHVEVLRMDSDQPADRGQTGRIVVTDLFNYAMPFIRYDTGDLGCLSESTTQGGRHRILDDIRGRRLDVLTTPEGERISPHLIDYAVRLIPGLGRFQFEQSGQSQYKIRVVPAGALDIEAVRRALEESLGSAAIIAVELVDTIPQEPSGKSPLVINRHARPASSARSAHTP